MEILEILKIIGSIAGIISALLTLLLRKKVQEYHLQINGRMGEYIEAVKAQKLAEGKLKGKEEERIDQVEDKNIKK